MKRTLLLIFLLLNSVLYSQNTDTIAYKLGGYASINLNFHNADFQKLQGIPNCCSKFEDGFGVFQSIGLLYESKINKEFSIGGRLGYNNYSGLLKKDDFTTVMKNDIPQEGKFEHSIDAKLAAISLNPYGLYEFGHNLFLNAGFELGSLVKNTFEQKFH